MGYGVVQEREEESERGLADDCYGGDDPRGQSCRREWRRWPGSSEETGGRWGVRVKRAAIVDFGPAGREAFLDAPPGILILLRPTSSVVHARQPLNDRHSERRRSRRRRRVGELPRARTLTSPRRPKTIPAPCATTDCTALVPASIRALCSVSVARAARQPL